MTREDAQWLFNLLERDFSYTLHQNDDGSWSIRIIDDDKDDTIPTVGFITSVARADDL